VHALDVSVFLRSIVEIVRFSKVLHHYSLTELLPATSGMELLDKIMSMCLFEFYIIHDY